MLCISTWLLRRLNMTKSSEIKIWRYLSLPKFIDFIVNENIAFSRADTFADKKEGISNELIRLINTYKAEKEKYSDNNSNFPYVGIGNPIDGLLLHALSTEEKKHLSQLIIEQKKYFISCWFVSENESMAMWDLYAKDHGVAIQTTIDVVVNSVTSTKFFVSENFKHKQVTYNNISKIASAYFENTNEVFDLLFRKDISYEHEKEYRFIISDDLGGAQIPSKSVKLDCSSLNKFKIITHPLMPDWQYKNIRQLCEKKVILKNISKSSLK